MSGPCILSQGLTILCSRFEREWLFKHTVCTTMNEYKGNTKGAITSMFCNYYKVNPFLLVEQSWRSKKVVNFFPMSNKPKSNASRRLIICISNLFLEEAGAGGKALDKSRFLSLQTQLCDPELWRLLSSQSGYIRWLTERLSHWAPCPGFASRGL